VIRPRTWIAFLATVVAGGLVAAGVLYVVVFAPAEPRDLPAQAEPAAQGPAAPGAESGTAPGKQPPPTGDATEAFRAFANEGEPFPPEWLVRTKRVYWVDGGALWADATMPNAPPERVRTIEQICAKLSEYVSERLRLDWNGVSVRTTDGKELLTRTNTTDPCRPAA
jgi:hypothetical protein